MTCNDVQQMTSEFIDDELEEGAEHLLFGHLETCEVCRQFMRSTLRSHATMLRAPVPAVPETLDARIAALNPPRCQPRAAVSFRWRELLRRRFLVPVPAALGGLLLLLFSVCALVTLMVSGPQERVQGVTPAGYVVTLPEVEVRGIAPLHSENIR